MKIGNNSLLFLNAFNFHKTASGAGLNDLKMKDLYFCLLLFEECKCIFKEPLTVVTKPNQFLRRLAKIKAWIDEHDPGSPIIPFSGSFEFKLIDMPDDEREKYLKEKATAW